MILAVSSRETAHRVADSAQLLRRWNLSAKPGERVLPAS